MTEKKVFVNLSNHPCAMWGEEQTAAAHEYGEITDYTFPVIPADADEDKIDEAADRVFSEVMSLNPAAVMCQGEFTLTYALVKRFIAAGVKALSACSVRNTVTETDANGVTTKKAVFCFAGFREYR